MCAEPAVIATAVRLVPSETADSEFPIWPAVRPSEVTAPYPSRPLVPSPQHFTVELSSKAQLCDAPVAIIVAVRPVPKSIAASESPISPAPSPNVVVAP